jgi:uncharacterized membrane protein YdjX (TVP38/TMEM64 family)
MPDTAPPASSKLYWRFLGTTFFTFLLLFALAQALGLEFLSGPEEMGQWALPVAALVGVGLLIADIVLPVPSSMIMVAHGTLFGVAGGAALSVLGTMTAAMTGYWLGKKGKRWLSRWFEPAHFAIGDRFFARWGVFAVIVSRPIPLINETISIAAGAAELSWQRMLLGSFLGSAPTALAYAWAGTQMGAQDVGLYAFLGVIGVSGAFVGLGWLIQRRKKDGK